MSHVLNNFRYSFVVPIYNDGYLVESFCEAINDEMKRVLDITDIANDVEVIFVNDGSSDESQQQLEATATRYSFVKVVELSRNFGQHLAVSSGYTLASGSYVGMFYIVLNSFDERTRLIEHLKSQGILALFHYVPLHTSPMGTAMGYCPGMLPVTETVSERLLRLPMYYEMQESEIELVVDEICRFFKVL